MASALVRGRTRGRRGGGVFRAHVTKKTRVLNAYPEEGIGENEAQEPGWESGAELSMGQSHMPVDATSKMAFVTSPLEEPRIPFLQAMGLQEGHCSKQRHHLAPGRRRD